MAACAKNQAHPRYINRFLMPSDVTAAGADIREEAPRVTGHDPGRAHRLSAFGIHPEQP
jgi:hypothetical protein